MSAIARLAWVYFTATPLTRGLAALGLACVVAGIAGYATIPAWTLGIGLRQEALWHQTLILAMPWFGLVLLLAASARLPAIVERLALGRLIWVLPTGRARLLASIIVPAALLALLTAFASSAAFVVYIPEPERVRIFYRTLLMAFVDFGLIYSAIWLVGKTSGIWRLAGLLWVIVSILIPMRYLAGIPPFSPLEGIGLAAWLTFGAILLAGGRVRHAFRAIRARAAALAARALPAARFTPGNETALMLGTGRPWIVALGQVIPIAILVSFTGVSGRDAFLIILSALSVFSAISGAVTSQAAARSRRVWLRLDWQRDEIFLRVERAYWRYNAWSLGVLLILFAGVGLYAGFPANTMLLGAGLLVMGCVVFHYLGLMITRPLGVSEAAPCILTMTALMLGALAIGRLAVTVALQIGALLVVLCVVYRFLARARWSALDWMRCGAGSHGPGAK